MISKKIGIVTEIVSSTDYIDDIRVEVNGQIQKAYNYIKLTGGISVGDEIVLNTTAVELSLGTGGYHFVISNLNNIESDMTIFNYGIRQAPSLDVGSIRDGASLPIYLSMNVSNLKEKGLIDETITIGNAFGGDYECINI